MNDMTHSEMVTAIVDFFETNLPDLVSSAGLTAIDEFLDRPPTESKDLQCAVYLAEGTDTKNNKRDAFIIQFQLFKEKTPMPYLDIIWPLVRSFDPRDVGSITMETTWQTWYPGEIGNGYGSSFIYLEMAFSRDLDDCDDDDY